MQRRDIICPDVSFKVRLNLMKLRDPLLTYLISEIHANVYGIVVVYYYKCYNSDEEKFAFPLFLAKSFKKQLAQ